MSLRSISSFGEADASRGVSSGSKAAAASDRLAKLYQRLAVARGRVAQAEMHYGRERASSVVLTWKYCTLEMPAVVIHLKGVDASRAEVLASCAKRMLEAISEHSTMVATAAVERQGQAATHTAREAEWDHEAAV